MVETFQPVMVIWQDAHAIGTSWIHEMEDTLSRLVITVGMVFPNLNKAGHTVVVKNLDSEGNIDAIIAIPQECIFEIIPLGKERSVARTFDSYR